MKKNVGVIDTWIRIILAVVGVILYLTHAVTGALGIIVLVLTAILVLTGVFKFCPMYVPLGIRTIQKEKKS